MTVRKLTELSALLAISVVLGIIENLIPTIPIPGVKLGLANIVILIVVQMFSPKDAYALLLLRVFLVSVQIGTFLSPTFIISLSGGLFAVTTMILVHKTKWFSAVGISVMGSIGHSVGQILAVWLVIGILVPYYLVFIILLSVPTGIFTGLVAKKYIQLRSSDDFFSH